MIDDNDCDISTRNGQLYSCYTAGGSHPTYRAGDEVPCVLMQCTGLKDKHGKFIYEGDFVRGKTSNKFCIDKLTTKTITWSGLSARFHASPSYFEDLAHFVNHCDKGIEIIGNIYENSELVEKS